MVDHVNREKEVVHFIVSRDVSGLVPFSDIVGTFQEGDGIAVRRASLPITMACDIALWMLVRPMKHQALQ